MPRIDIARFTTGALIALLFTSLVLTGVGLYWRLPRYSEEIAAQLLQPEPAVEPETSVSDSVLVPATTVVGHSTETSEPIGTQYVRDTQEIIEVRVPAQWTVEHLSDGFLLKDESVSSGQNEIQIVVSAVTEGDAKSALATMSEVPTEQIVSVEGQSKGFLAQAREGSQALFRKGTTQVVMTAATTSGELLTEFQAVIRTLRFI
jgi:hypothetical protein